LVATETVAAVPAGKVRIKVLHRWAYTTVLEMCSAIVAGTQVALEVRLYHDAGSAEVTAVRYEEEGEKRSWSFHQGGDQPKDKLYWNTFLAAWLAHMQVHIYAVPAPVPQCANSSKVHTVAPITPLRVVQLSDT